MSPHSSISPCRRLKFDKSLKIKWMVDLTNAEAAVLPVAAPLPPPMVICLISKLAYKDKPEDHIKKFQSKGQLLDWEILAVGTNRKHGNAYFGIALWSKVHRQLVVSHRGTKLKCWGSIWTDIKGVYFNKITSQMLSAVRFTHDVLAATCMFVDSIMFTGHSLGGWLAGICTYTAQFLQLKHEDFRFVPEEDCQFKPHTVIFDSPGFKNMLLSIHKACEPTCRKLQSFSELDIVNYLSGPNFINTTDEHIETLIHIQNEPERTLLSWLCFSGRTEYMRTEHSINSIVDVFDEDTGYVKKEAQLMVDWPTHVCVDLMNLSSAADETQVPVSYKTASFDPAECSLVCLNKQTRQFLCKALPLLKASNVKPPVTSPYKELYTFLKNCQLLSDPIKGELIHCESAQHLSALVPCVLKIIKDDPLYFYEALSKFNLRKIKEKFPVKFTSCVSLNEDQNEIHVITKEDEDIVTLRLVQSLKPKKVLAMYLSNLREADEDAQRRLKNSQDKHTILINCKGSSDNVWELPIIKNLITTGCKLIVVTCCELSLYPGTAQLLKLPQTCWDDITLQTKLKLLEQKCVIFQDSEEMLSFQDLLFLSETDSSENIIDAFTLGKLIRKEKIVIGGNLPKIESKFYIERRMEKSVYQISQEFLENLPRDYEVYIKGISENDFSVLLKKDSNYMSKHFHFDDKKITSENWCCIYHKNGLFYLQDFDGFIEIMRRHLTLISDEDLESNSGREYCCQFHEKEIISLEKENEFLIICGEPGSGKSTLLNCLSAELRGKYPRSWVIRIILNNVTQVLHKLISNSSLNVDSSEAIIDILVSDLLAMQGIEKAMLRYCLLNKYCKVSILIDGLDEISPNYEDLVCMLIGKLHCHTKARHIIITTRNHLREDLENRFSRISYSLVPFSPVDTEKFIKEKLKNTSGILNAILQLSKSKELKSHITNPLFLEILVETANEPSLDVSNSWVMYNAFIDRKFRVEHEKCDVSFDKPNEISRLKMFKNIALLYFKKIAEDNFFGDTKLLGNIGVNSGQVELLTSLMGQMESVYRIGIVNESRKFFHFTFEEFFVSQRLADILVLHSIEQSNSTILSIRTHNFLMNELLLKREHAIIRKFLNDFLTLNETYFVPKLNNEGQISRQPERNGEWVFHVLAKENNLSLFKYLWKYAEVNGFVMIIEKEMGKGNVFGQTPLHIAAKLGHFEILTFLAEKKSIVSLWKLEDKDEITPINFALGIVMLQGADLQGWSRWLEAMNLHNIHRSWISNIDSACDEAIQSLKHINDGRFFNTNFEPEREALHTMMQIRLGGISSTPQTEGQTSKLHQLMCKPSERSEMLKAVAGFRTEDWIVHDDNMNTPVHFAASSGKIFILEYLNNIFSDKSHLNLINKDHDTPLHLAMRVNNIADEEEKLLLQLFEIRHWTSKNLNGQTAPHLAAFHAKYVVLNYLRQLMGGNDFLQLRDRNDCTVLHYMMVASILPTANDEDILLRWVQHAHIDNTFWMQENCSGDTPVHWAAFKGKWSILKFLRQHSNGQVFLKANNRVCIPLHDFVLFDAKTTKDKDIMINAAKECFSKEEWTKKNWKGDTPVHLAAYKGNTFLLAACSHLFDVEGCLKWKNNSGLTPLHCTMNCVVASKEEEDLMLQWLQCFNKADWGVTNCRGYAPVHWAALKGKIFVLKYLSKVMSNEEILSILNNDCLTVIHFAMQTVIHSSEDEAALLRWVSTFDTVEPWEMKTCYGDTPASWAAFKGKTFILEYLWKTFPNAEFWKCQNEKGFSILHDALRHTFLNTHEAAASFQLIKNAFPADFWSTKNCYGDTPVHWAAFEGKTSVLEHLMEIMPNNEYVKWKSNDGMTPLHDAVRASSLESEKVLLKWMRKCCTIEDWLEKDHKGNSAAHWAVYAGNYFILLYLDEIFPNREYVSWTNDRNYTCLHDALRFSYLNKKNRGILLDWFKVAIRPSDWQCRNYVGDTPLNWAAHRGHYFVLEYVAEIFPEEEYLLWQNKDLYNILHEVMMTGDSRMMKWVKGIRRKDVWRQGDKEGDTPVHIAALKGRIFILDHLNQVLSDGEHLTWRNNDGDTPLHEVMRATVHSGQDEEELLRWVKSTCSREHWEFKGSYGSTPVHRAALNGKIFILLYLNELFPDGEHLMWKNDNRYTPLHHIMRATLNGEVDELTMLKWLNTCKNISAWEARTIEGDSPAHWAAYKGKIFVLEYLRKLLPHCQFISWKNNAKMTPLHDAMRSIYTGAEHRRAVLRWLDSVDDSEWTDVTGCGNTSVHLAARTGNVFILLYLLKKIPNRDYLLLVNEYKETPLHLAMQAKVREEDSQDLVTWVQSCAQQKDWFVKNYNGLSPVHIAALASKIYILEYLSDEMPNHNHLKEKSGIGLTALHYLMARPIESDKEKEVMTRWLRVFRGDVTPWLVQGSHGYTPLHIAAMYNKYWLLSSLSYHKQVMNAVTSQGDTILHVALCRRLNNDHRWELRRWLTVLANNNFNWITRNQHKQTILHQAAFWSNFSALSYLASISDTHKCLSMKDCSGLTPVQQAMCSNPIDESTKDKQMTAWLQSLSKHGQNIMIEQITCLEGDTENELGLLFEEESAHQTTDVDSARLIEENVIASMTD